MAKRRATSKDVAERAGVSRSAVSLVLNGRGKGNISDANQRAILAAARDLEYQPNAMAVGLRARRTMTLGVVTDSIGTTAFGGRILTGARQAALAEGYTLITAVDTDDRAELEEGAFELLTRRGVDGYLFAAMGMHERPTPKQLRQSAGVMLNCYDPHAYVPSVCADERPGGRAAAETLLAAGHRDIVWIGGSLDVIPARLRLAGYHDAMAAAGLPPRRPTIGGWTIGDGYAAGMTVLQSEQRPSGILAANDRAAVGIALAAARLGIDIPRDLSLVGYDDDENIAGVMVPPLTTVRLPHEEIGEVGVRLLLERITDPASATPPPQVLVHCPLVRRESVAPPGR